MSVTHVLSGCGEISTYRRCSVIRLNISVIFTEFCGFTTAIPTSKRFSVIRSIPTKNLRFQQIYLSDPGETVAGHFQPNVGEFFHSDSTQEGFMAGKSHYKF